MAPDRAGHFDETSKEQERLSTHPLQPEVNPYFRVDHLMGDLVGRSIRGSAVTIASQACKFLMSLGATAVLARLLTPKDFGLIAMVMAITGFISMFKDLGLSIATVQRGEIHHRQVSTLFWINASIGAAIMLMTAAISPAVAWFYHEPRLERITLTLSVAFLFGGLAVQHQALLRRQMRFVAMTGIEIASIIVGFTAGIVSAWQGAGYWSLVIMHLTAEVARTLGVWLLCRWRPGAPARRSGVRSMMTFGGNLAAVNTLHYITRSLDNVLIGRFWGASMLGLYSKAYKLLLLPIQQINTPVSIVALPTLSRLQNDPGRYRAFYLKGILLMVTFSMPIVAFLFVTADKVILSVLGPQWTGAVTIFRVLSLAAFMDTFNVATGWIFISLGQTHRQFRWQIIATIVTVLCFGIGISWGAIGVAAAFSIARCGLRYPALRYCYRSSPIKMKMGELFSVLWRPAAASMLAGCELFLLDRYLFPPGNIALRLLADFLGYGVLYILNLALLPGGRETLRTVLQAARELRSGRGSVRMD